MPRRAGWSILMTSGRENEGNDHRAGRFPIMTRGLLRSLLLLFPLLGILNAVYFIGRLRGLVEDLKVLTSEWDMKRYRHEVRLQMYASLLQIGLLGAPVVLFFYGLFSHRLPGGDVLYVIIPSAVVILVGKILQRVELEAKNMPASTPELERERNRVVHVWNTRPLPDWSD